MSKIGQESIFIKLEIFYCINTLNITNIGLNIVKIFGRFAIERLKR